MESSPPEPQLSLAQIVQTFVSTLKRLMADLARRVPNDATIARAQKRLVLASDAVPVDILTVAGPYLYNYREAIYSDDETVWKRFFDGGPETFQQDLESAEDPTKKDAAEYMIPKIQTIAHGLVPEEQRQYLEATRDLLDSYLDYLVATQK